MKNRKSDNKALDAEAEFNVVRQNKTCRMDTDSEDPFLLSHVDSCRRKKEEHVLFQARRQVKKEFFSFFWTLKHLTTNLFNHCAAKSGIVA